MITVKQVYSHRFSPSENEYRKQVWNILCSSFLQQFVRSSDAVIDIGAGYCEFINTIKCRKKIAIDINPDTRIHAAKNVDVIQTPAHKPPSSLRHQAHVVFMSNFLEHLESKDEVLAVLIAARALLKKGGTILIMQPNIDLVKERYWDFFDHKVVLNGPSVIEALELAGFTKDVYIKRFLPYTAKSRYIPKFSSLTRFYLLLPEFLRPFAGQSFFSARNI